MAKNRAAVQLGRKGGSSTSEKKRAASRANAAKARETRQNNAAVIASALHNLRSDHVQNNLFRLGAIGAQEVKDAVRLLESTGKARAAKKEKA